MTSIATIRRQLREAGDLPSVLDAAYAAFDYLRSALRAWEADAGSEFGAFMMAAGRAADGRDAVGLAPSLPAGPPPVAGADAWFVPAAELVAMCWDLSTALERSAGLAVGRDDRDACQQAAQFARRIHVLFIGREQ